MNPWLYYRKLPVTDSHPAPAVDEMSAEDQYIITRFSDTNFTDTLFKYLALEGKNKDSFTSRNYSFFKVLIHNKVTLWSIGCHL